ncbi:MAG: tRNA threonylcarbamoyladenosine dehydratase [Candidatus Cloacimonadota bacterium]|nr:MAG: tRNA threonylcarbamoyladenosine dehydratase [Candidatus Cloacimonadota bacterium]PIE79578.1 MAG: tRNA threonylcarbamoyladenosine dehydratase [Candidatus Delongbacteria bacterium]
MTLGEDNLDILNSSHILVCGLGGVGAYTSEMLVRSGIGEITIVDNDSVDISNINRQLIALHSTIGKKKSYLMRDRVLDINPNLKVNIFNIFINDESIEEIFKIRSYDYIVDAIDTLTPKVALIRKALDLDIPLVSSMGAGAKFDPTKIEVSDISKTYICPLAHAVRRRLKKFNINRGFKAVFSTERHDSKSVIDGEHNNFKRSQVGTVSYMPPVFGCVAASVVIRDLCNK